MLGWCGRKDEDEDQDEDEDEDEEEECMRTRRIGCSTFPYGSEALIGVGYEKPPAIFFAAEL